MKGNAGIALLFCLGLAVNMGLLIPSPAQAQEEVLPDSSWFVDMKTYAKGAHASLTCQQCHPQEQASLDPASGRRHPDPPNSAYLKASARREFDYRTCRTCHRLAFERYGKGVHATALAQNKTAILPDGSKAAAPVCADCHDPHYQPAHRDRMKIGRYQAIMCGSCHPAQAATYLNDFHGKAAVNLGHNKAAFCTDCHGAHTCLSLKEAKTAQTACRRCHPQAGPRFASYVVHPVNGDLKQDDQAKAFRVWLICLVTGAMAVLAVLVVGFFYGHGFVWMLREIQEKLRKYDHD